MLKNIILFIGYSQGQFHGQAENGKIVRAVQGAA
jgi:hypothetical protein